MGRNVTNVQFVLMPSDARAGMIVGLVYEQRVYVVEADEVHFVHGLRRFDIHAREALFLEKYGLPLLVHCNAWI